MGCNSNKMVTFSHAFDLQWSRINPQTPQWGWLSSVGNAINVASVVWPQKSKT